MLIEIELQILCHDPRLAFLTGRKSNRNSQTESSYIRTCNGKLRSGRFHVLSETVT